ncbi:MAG: DUF6858 family protein [Sulfurimonas sp.]
MTKTAFMDKYPVFSYELAKSETNYTSVDEIIEYFKTLVQQHPIATEITTFDHYAHTKSLNDGEIAPEIKDAKNFIFCFGKQLPNTKMLAVRPRSIGVSELEESFSIDFLQVPNDQLQELVVQWVLGLSKGDS